jgi:hypothetical protein
MTTSTTPHHIKERHDGDNRKIAYWRVPDLGGSFCDISFVGTYYVHEHASFILFYYPIMNSFMFRCTSTPASFYFIIQSWMVLC